MLCYKWFGVVKVITQFVCMLCNANHRNNNAYIHDNNDGLWHIYYYAAFVFIQGGLYKINMWCVIILPLTTNKDNLLTIKGNQMHNHPVCSHAILMSYCQNLLLRLIHLSYRCIKDQNEANYSDATSKEKHGSLKNKTFFNL